MHKSNWESFWAKEAKVFKYFLHAIPETLEFVAFPKNFTYLAMDQNSGQFPEFDVRKSILSKGESSPVSNNQSARGPFVAGRQVRGAGAGRRGRWRIRSWGDFGWEYRVRVDIIGTIGGATIVVIIGQLAFRYLGDP